MTTTKNYTAPDKKKVLVRYHDDSERETTVKELKELFKEEDKRWSENFFYELTTRFEAFGKFAKYSIILD